MMQKRLMLLLKSINQTQNQLKQNNSTERTPIAAASSKKINRMSEPKRLPYVGPIAWTAKIALRNLKTASKR